MIKNYTLITSNHLSNMCIIVKVYKQHKASWMKIQRLYNSVQTSSYIQEQEGQISSAVKKTSYTDDRKTHL